MEVRVEQPDGGRMMEEMMRSKGFEQKWSVYVLNSAEFAALHSSGARSVFYATLANTVNAPVTLDISTERATLSLRGDLTVTYDDGRSEVVRERARDRAAGPTGAFRMPC